MVPRKAIALLSGGLDSALAAKLMIDQGIEVIGLHLVSPFGCKLPVDDVARHLGIRLIKKEKGEAYLELVKHPQYGYGKNMNPCIDCRIYMFQLAEVVMKEEGADFVVTGEVIGQRPMSQMRHSMELIDSRTALKGLLLRPLSAKTMDPTVPETKGWVDREKLMQISGRGRKDQLELAGVIGVTGYAAPGGGCLLTETEFSNRLRDFFGHEDGLDSARRLAQSQLLHLGRHFRLNEKLKFIIGRNAQENEALALLWEKSGASYMHPETFRGPDAVAVGPIDSQTRSLIARVLMRYSKVDPSQEQEFTFCQGPLAERMRVSGSVNDSELQTWRL
ncbi:MAG: hypothetical protein HYR96_06670 [Deltaproteobacteria bacterium]|nr:hypothetical protein [Deltaproteobacteria bacterium]MBI3296455.1 hypothetical protein [Deltaproteobacteria bacterium]